MHYTKKICILKQIRSGFSADGKPISGLVKIEQYGKNVAVEVSIINFAPLNNGEYYCLIADNHHHVETLPLYRKSLFNLVSHLDVEDGFTAVVCFVKGAVLPVAYGVNGALTLDVQSLVNGWDGSVYGDTETPPKPSIPSTPLSPKNAFLSEETAKTTGQVRDLRQNYDDDRVAEDNYFLEENNNAQNADTKNSSNVRPPLHRPTQAKITRSEVGADEDAESVLHPFTVDGNGYYDAVKQEIDDLFHAYPSDERLKTAFESSEWVRLKGDANRPEYLVGVVYENLRAKYLCYALLGEADHPPEEIKDVSVFIPCSSFDDRHGFFVLFQSASTGESILPSKA